jgi:hypothetical protein
MSDIIENVKNRDPDQKEFIQAVTEVMESVKPVLDQNPLYRELKIPERLVEPDRVIPGDSFPCPLGGRSGRRPGESRVSD